MAFGVIAQSEKSGRDLRKKSLQHRLSLGIQRTGDGAEISEACEKCL
jgi:hypothetical protein